MFCPGDRSDKAAFVKLLLNVTKKCDLFHYIYKVVKSQEKWKKHLDKWPAK